MRHEDAHDREVAGIRCSAVLEVLSDYLDGELDAATTDRVDRHLAGCDWCERFGGDFADAVTALRRALADAPPPPADIARRLRDRLARPD